MWPKYQKPHYPYKDSTQVPWQLTNETFVFMSTSFSVPTGKEIALRTKHPILALEVEPLRQWIAFPSADNCLKMLAITVNWEDVPSVNLDIPVLVATLKASALPIDGWHRIARALQIGEKSVPCVLLNKAETKKVQF